MAYPSTAKAALPKKRFRKRLLPFALASTSLLVLTAKEIFDYSAPPTKEKGGDYTFPQYVAANESPFVPALGNQIKWEQRGGSINDASVLNRTDIFGIIKVDSEDTLRSALQFARDNKLKITCAGERHSMGGQSFAPGGVVLDLRPLNQIKIDKDRKIVTVQSGARWSEVQQALDGVGLSVKSMQSINIFSIGGSLSVNGHGIDPSPGSISSTVRSIRVMLSTGQVVEASPLENADLFRHVLGGYGLFGVILDVDLNVVPNEMYSREAAYLDYKDFPRYYDSKIAKSDDIGLVFGRLSVAPWSYLRETAVHVYRKVPFDGSVPALTPPKHENLARFVVNASKTGAMGRSLRWTLEKYVEPKLHECVSRNQAMQTSGDCVVTRNKEMYDDMKYLKNRLEDTDILQEYFIPRDRLPEFVDSLREVVQRNGANLLNATIRTVAKDTITALPYAKQDMFGLVLYFNVKFNNKENSVLEKTTTDLIDSAEESGGTFYLPYQLFYTKEQLRKAYPEVDDFFLTKRKYDPSEVFTNKFYEKYGRGSALW